ncbi:hypothetical protein [Zavarzinia compransoris]|uniref:Uncharacterized protein n=1 Tax=Zavarzinia compransoris TaxID=1264899 RepID=A0A317DZ76_9PROT|nr:hypothetical protein [Zavarzinia compransoris]PWR18353.1 hypothetical protein DKG75_20535 [Zavarzinia compransoris]
MRRDLDQYLCAKYPKIFVDRHADMRVTAMCWGFSCGDGWFGIIDRLCGNLQEISDRTECQAVAVQVKEKFGGLRFYIRSGDTEHLNAITEAENASYLTCEECGEPGRLREERSWLRTLCDRCDAIDLVERQVFSRKDADPARLMTIGPGAEALVVAALIARRPRSRS